MQATTSWIPLALLKARFTANIAALRNTHAALADSLAALAAPDQYHILPQADSLLVGLAMETGIQTLPNRLPPAEVRKLLPQIFPTQLCTEALLVVGEQQGWLWNAMYGVECKSPGLPGHRPPLYFIIKELQLLQVLLYLHDWRALLADARVRLFAGENCFDQLRQSLAENIMIPWPRRMVNIDSSLIPPGTTIDSLIAEASAKLKEKLASLTGQMKFLSEGFNAEAFAERIRSGQSLRILGITSRYTTFLQHSMADWLAAFEQLGHCTQIVIEQANHNAANSLAAEVARQCVEFKPDLIVLIDHSRLSAGGMPENIPVAMWVQDNLPHIFNRQTGEGQKWRDYALGFAKQRLVKEFGYPASRYMPAVVGVNENRFQPRTLSAAELDTFGCDVSFVSHASKTAEAILAEECAQLNSNGTRLLKTIFEQLKAVYDDGGMVTEPVDIRQMIDRGLAQAQVAVGSEQIPLLMDLFRHRINNALFRHQSLHWLADMGVNLHLYGNGWEQHPTFKKFARGPANNATQLATIYQASRINLHISPHGAVHQRVFEGLAAGGFFLLRFVPGELLERHLRPVHEFCVMRQISSDAQLRAAASAEILQQIEAASTILGFDVFAQEVPFMESLSLSAEAGFTASAGTVWGEAYDRICYRSADELRDRVEHFLHDEEDRRQIAAQMREPVLRRFTYLATAQRFLNFIADDLQNQRLQLAA